VEAAARTEEAGLGFLVAGLGLVVLGLFLGRAAVLDLDILYQAEGPVRVHRSCSARVHLTSVVRLVAPKVEAARLPEAPVAIAERWACSSLDFPS
jgi:hypothetical protein